GGAARGAGARGAGPGGQAGGGGRGGAGGAGRGGVLRNLLANATRHPPADGTVEVAAAAEDGKACLAVADSCGGIPTEDLPRVFEIAFRGQAARTPAGDGGAGLGLAIARGIVEAHEGGIPVGTRAHGVQFYVTPP